MEKKVVIDICFVVLHYNVVDVTISLIDSIKKLLSDCKYRIVVVDNCSPNESGKLLYRQYFDDEKVKVVLLNANEGFARGNNAGIKYARQNYTCKFVCCINNDTLIIQKNFIQLIDKEFKKSNSAVIGPKILLKDGSFQKSAYKLNTLEYYKKLLIFFENRKYENVTNNIGLKGRMKRWFPTLYIKMKNIKDDFFGNKLLFKQYNVVLHGCCLIFTPSFFEKLDGFNPNTFLYHEEELLYISLLKENLKSVYCPSIKIKHLEDVSTNSINRTNKEKIKFINKNEVDSLNILIKELESIKM